MKSAVSLFKVVSRQGDNIEVAQNEMQEALSVVRNWNGYCCNVWLCIKRCLESSTYGAAVNDK